MTLNFAAVILPFGMLVPLVISISRFTDNRHHPTVSIFSSSKFSIINFKDIIAGALLGAFIAYSVHHADVVANRKV